MEEQYWENSFPDESYLEESSDAHSIYRVDFKEGFGRMTAYNVMPGVTLIFNDFHTSSGFENEMRRPGMVEINHCRVGRYECALRDGSTVSLGPLDFAVSDMGCPPRISSFTYGEYHGISLVVEIAVAQSALKDFLGNDAPDLTALFNQIFYEHTVLILKADSKIQQLFSDLYEAPTFCRGAYFKLKAAELFLFLECRKNGFAADVRRYLSHDLAERIREIEHRMTQDLRLHIPIAELAAHYKMSETTIKKRFLQLYGEPPYVYLKRRRMETAAFLLETSELSVSEIAARVGYQNASKFSKSFCDIYGIVPREYKKGALSG
ncbi:HTH-type transcriptional activator RhaR [bioreactor metagenome]|uniref:HTH-type transcriptional activator RhaR n=1 Tax=bioreactor metagenome TaxID=1076179 RepID=A0A645BKZ7_9ZZZZ